MYCKKGGKCGIREKGRGEIRWGVGKEGEKKKKEENFCVSLSLYIYFKYGCCSANSKVLKK